MSAKKQAIKDLLEMGVTVNHPPTAKADEWASTHHA